MSTRRAAADVGARARDARPVPVVTAAARTGDVPVYLRGIGTATAFNTAALKSRVDGQLVSVAVKEGQAVREGELLAQIDPRPFDVQLEQAKGAARARPRVAEGRAGHPRARPGAAEGADPGSAGLRLAEGAGGPVRGRHPLRSRAGQERASCSCPTPGSPRPSRVASGLRLVDVGNIVHAADQNGLFVITQVQPDRGAVHAPRGSTSRHVTAPLAGRACPCTVRSL